MSKKIVFFLLVFLFIAFPESKGERISIRARLDSVNMLMGKINTLHLEVVEDKGSNGSLNIFRNADRSKGFVPVCGDSVELLTNFVIDTLELGSGRLQLNYAIPVQSFDSGFYTLPKFVYYVGKDSAVSNSLSFNVFPVEVTSEDPIAGFDTVHGPDGAKWYDWVPDWIIDFWWIFIIVVLAVILGLYSMKNFKRESLPFISPKPQPKPWEVALQSLQKLKARKLWEQGMEKEYFTDLTDILRVYLVERFGINALEMTTRQIMDKINESDLREKKSYVKQILSVADFVKFAKVRPLPADSIAAYENAKNFITETIPQENIDKETTTSNQGDQ